MLKKNKKLMLIITLALGFNIISPASLNTKVYATTLTPEQQEQIINDKESYLENLNTDEFLDEMKIWEDNIKVFKNSLKTLKDEELNAKCKEDYDDILNEYKESKNTIKFTKAYNKMLDKVVNNKFSFYRNNLNTLENQYNDMYNKFNQQEKNFRTAYDNFENGISKECYDEYNKLLDKTNALSNEGNTVLDIIKNKPIDEGNKALSTYRGNISTCEKEITNFKNKYNKNSSPEMLKLFNNLNKSLTRAKIKLNLCNLEMQKKELDSEIINKPDLIPDLKPNIKPDLIPNVDNNNPSNSGSNVLDELSNILDQIHKLNNEHKLNNIPKLNELSIPNNTPPLDNSSNVIPSDNKINTATSKDKLIDNEANKNNVELPKTGINSFVPISLIAAFSTLAGIFILFINKLKIKNKI